MNLFLIGEKDSNSVSSEAETASAADTPKHSYTPKVTKLLWLCTCMCVKR